VKNIVLPKDNEKDLSDIPKNVLDALNIHMVEAMDEVLKIALLSPLPVILPPSAPETTDEPAADDTITH